MLELMNFWSVYCCLQKCFLKHRYLLRLLAKFSKGKLVKKIKIYRNVFIFALFFVLKSTQNNVSGYNNRDLSNFSGYTLIMTYPLKDLRCYIINYHINS